MNQASNAAIKHEPTTPDTDAKEAILQDIARGIEAYLATVNEERVAFCLMFWPPSQGGENRAASMRYASNVPRNTSIIALQQMALRLAIAGPGPARALQ